MQILLVEDDVKHCDDFKDFVSSLTYPHSLHISNGESDGLKRVQQFLYDVLILDLELHKSDGDGLDFLKKLRQLNAPEPPYIIIVTNNNSPKTRETARELGADYIIWKGKVDYSPKLVMDLARTYFLGKMDSLPSEPPPVRSYSLEDEIKRHISAIGVNDDMNGKKYVIDAIAIVAKSNDSEINLNVGVYPVIAKRYSKSDGSVKKAIQAAIEKAWTITDDEIIAANYKAVVSGIKGTPTNKEFIFYFANKIKEESCKA